MTPRSSGRKIGWSRAAASQVPDALTQSTSPTLTELLPPAPCTRSISSPIRAETSISSAGGVVPVIIVHPLPSEQRNHPIGHGIEPAIERRQLGVALAGAETARDEHRRQPGATAARDVVLDAVADRDAALISSRTEPLEAVAIDLGMGLADEAHLAAALLVPTRHLAGAEGDAARTHR